MSPGQLVQGSFILETNIKCAHNVCMHDFQRNNKSPSEGETLNAWSVTCYLETYAKISMKFAVHS